MVLNAIKVIARIAVYSRVRRSRMDMLHLLAQHVAHAAHGLDQARLAAGLGLLAQVADIDLQHVVLTAEIVAPHFLQDLLAAQHLAGVAQQVVQQIVLLGSQAERAVAAPGLARHRVEAQVGIGQRFIPGEDGGAAQQRMDARQQLGRRKRLDQIVVRAGFQPLDTVFDRIARGEHQDERLVARRPQVFQHADAVQPRHQPVEHDDIRAVRLHLSQRLGAVGGAEHAKTLVRQRAPQHRQEFGIIVYDQNGCHLASTTARFSVIIPSSG